MNRNLSSTSIIHEDKRPVDTPASSAPSRRRFETMTINEFIISEMSSLDSEKLPS